MGSQLPREPSIALQPGGPMGIPMGEQADSAGLQVEGLTDPHNSVGAGALISQLPAAAQTAAQTSPTVLPAAAQEDVKASYIDLCMAVIAVKRLTCYMLPDMSFNLLAHPTDLILKLVVSIDSLLQVTYLTILSSPHLTH